jgi:hypothetical protein
MKCEFAAIAYDMRKKSSKPNTHRLETIGMDTESLNTGEVFMFTFSDGIAIPKEDLFPTLFSRRYRGKKFVCFNLKYDEGSILQLLDNDALKKLRETGKTEWNGYIFRLIPRKELSISYGHKSVCFYDIAQFFAMSLDNAAKKYLGKSKEEIETKTFTPEYVKDNWQKIAHYSIIDSKLTQELAEYLINILIDEFAIYPQKLYSTGYITGVHFSRVCDIIDVRRYYKYYPELLEFAYNSYAGGKFEVYKRGYGYFYQYDLNSAYPYQIQNLKDIRNARISHSKEYESGADYGFIK